MDDKINKELRDAARRFACIMKDECDGTYVGEEMEPEIEILGEKTKLFVIAFWEKSFWFDFSATIDGVKYSESGCN